MNSACTIDTIIERVESLPRLQDAATQLLAVISDPKSGLRDIVAAIRYDAAVTAEVLRLCNSAAFGLGRSVSSLEDALRFLGTAKVLHLVLAAHTRTLLGQPQAGFGLQPRDLWEHSVAVALAGQMLAQTVQPEFVGIVFTSGLLHDVGKIVLNEFVTQDYSRIIERVSAGDDFLEAEREVLGFTHVEVGERVLERWELPADMRVAVRWHLEPETAPQPSPVIDLVHLADCVCRLFGIGAGSDAMVYRAHDAVLQRCSLSESDLEAVGVEVLGELRLLRNLFKQTTE